MTDDILHTPQNPDELRCLATERLTAQAREYEQRIRELEDALKLAQQWRFGRKSERLPASQKPLADEDATSDEADITRQLSDLLPAKEKTSAPGGGLHGVVAYALKRWPALETYLNDGRVPLDNNRCEQMMRPV
ncbi:IS66 family transposase, partial [Escherichia coli]|uniref:IS66 family transposase n=1 Tax=Escherichia coli TaxID=562 RepID=UPI00201B11E8